MFRHYLDSQVTNIPNFQLNNIIDFNTKYFFIDNYQFIDYQAVTPSKHSHNLISYYFTFFINLIKN